MLMRFVNTNLLRKLKRNQDAIALTEFAVVAPVFLMLGMAGFEVANMATSKLQVSQIAVSLSDNASRLGQTDNSGVTPTISEADVDAVLKGALEMGANIGLEANGRIILSSLERDDVTGKQFIHWQRCIGSAEYDSAYGDEGSKNGLTGSPISGMGQGSSTVAAPPGGAVMYVEIYYTYNEVFANPFGENKAFLEEAAFIVRDDRALGDSDEKGISGTKINAC